MADKGAAEQTTRHFEAGEVVIEEGSLGRGLYVLLRGKLEVLRDEVVIATISQKGSFVGEISSILGCSCSATVRAKETADLMYIPKVTDYLEQNPQASYMLAQTLARRIMDMNEKFLSLEAMVRRLEKGDGQEVGTGAAEKIQGVLAEVQDMIVAPKGRKPGW